MKPLDLLPIALGIIALVLSHFLPDLAGILLPLGGGLVGQGLPNLSALGKKVPPAAGLALLLLLLGACAGNFRATLINNLKTCAASDPANLDAKAQALACLASAVSPDQSACISAVPVGVVWTLDELACVASAEAATIK